MTNRGPKLWVLRQPVRGVAEFRGDHWTIHPLPLDIVPGETISGQQLLFSRDNNAYDFGQGPQLTLSALSLVAPPATCWQTLRRTTVQFDGVQWRSVPGGSTCVAYPSTPGPMPLDDRVLGLIGGPAGRRPGAGVFDDGTWRLIAWTPPESTPITQIPFVRRSFTFDGGATTYTIGPTGNVNGGPRIWGVLQWDGNMGWTQVDKAFINPAGQAGSPLRYAVYDDGNGPALYTNHRPEPYSGLGHPLGNSIFRWRLGEGWTILSTFGEGDAAADIWGMEVFDDGRGEALYIAGTFFAFGGVPTRGLIRYDGKSFEGFEIFGYNTAGASAPAQPREIAVVDLPQGRALALVLGNRTGVTIGGGFVQTGLVALLSGQGCYANCDGSGPNTALGGPVLSPADFVCFLSKFRARDPYANCDASPGLALPGLATSPALTPEDFICFLNKFRAGCP